MKVAADLNGPVTRVRDFQLDSIAPRVQLDLPLVCEDLPGYDLVRGRLLPRPDRLVDRDHLRPVGEHGLDIDLRDQARDTG